MNFFSKSLSRLRNSLSGRNINFMSVHKLALVLSVIGIIGSIMLVAIRGLNFGIDFAGGILIEARIYQSNNSQQSNQLIDTSKLRNDLILIAKDVQIQNASDTTNQITSNQKINYQDFLIRIAKSDEDQTVIINKIKNNLQQKYPNIEYRKIDYVGPQVGKELIFDGFMALILSFIFIMIYIWIRFNWQYSIGGIFALIHDVFLTIGFFAITQLEFNLTSIASILTIIGYSINDSVVIYDRIRENMHRFKKNNLADLINSSINSTLSRTILTASATLVSLLALIFYGGEVLFSFSLATFFGILIGTYSSIYISAPILLYLDPRKKDKK